MEPNAVSGTLYVDRDTVCHFEWGTQEVRPVAREVTIMNARILGLTIAACAFFTAAAPGLYAAPVKPAPLRTGGFAIERGQVASLVGSGLPFQSRAATLSIAPGLGAPMYSDARLKTDVRTLADALTTVQNLRAVTFRWDPAQFKDRTVPAGRQIGFIAQETQRVLPEVITTDERGYLAIQYANVVPVLVEAIKEQQKQIDAKDAAIEKIRSDADEAVRDLQTRLTAVEDALSRMGASNAGSAANTGPWTSGGNTYQGQYQAIAPGVFRQF